MAIEKEHNAGVHASGDVTLLRKPDVAYVSLYVRAEGILLEDAVREAVSRVEQVLRTLRDNYGAEIKDIQVKDVHMGDGKPSMGLGLTRDKSNPPRPEVVKGVLVVIPPNPVLAVKVVDTGCRTGCFMTNPSGTPMQGASTVILYGLTDSAAAEAEATALAIAEARDNASRIATVVNRRLGAVKYISAMAFHGPEELTRRNKTLLLSRGTHLSVSPDYVEIPAKISAAFELLD